MHVVTCPQSSIATIFALDKHTRHSLSSSEPSESCLSLRFLGILNGKTTVALVGNEIDDDAGNACDTDAEFDDDDPAKTEAEDDDDDEEEEEYASNAFGRDCCGLVA